MKADTLSNGRQLTYGSYKDCSRPLRRCLKQLGSGSIERGFSSMKTDNKALEEVAALVDVDKQVPFTCHPNMQVGHTPGAALSCHVASTYCTC